MPNEDHFDTATREQLVTAIKHRGSHLISEARGLFSFGKLVREHKSIIPH